MTLIAITSLLGIAMSGWFMVVDHRFETRAAGTRFTNSDWIVWRIAELRRQWIAWFVFSGMLLMASLISSERKGYDSFESPTGPSEELVGPRTEEGPFLGCNYKRSAGKHGIRSQGLWALDKAIKRPFFELPYVS